MNQVEVTNPLVFKFSQRGQSGQRDLEVKRVGADSATKEQLVLADSVARSLLPHAQAHLFTAIGHTADRMPR